MDMISMWPLILAASLGSAGLAGAWWFQRQRHLGARGEGAQRDGQRRGRKRRLRRSAEPTQDEQLDTLAAWEPVATRVLKTGEREAYHVLRRALPDHIILAQVPLARFVKVPTRNSYSEWLRRVGSLCADLVVCDMSSQVVAVVEVRPGAAATKDNALKRQQRMDKVLQAARIPVHVWLEGALPGPAVAREAILGAAIQLSGRSGYQDVSLALRDANAAAMVASMQATPAPQPTAEVRSLYGHPQDGVDVTERQALDFDIDAWIRSESGDNDSADDQDAERKEPPPSTWFDDLDTDPGTGLMAGEPPAAGTRKQAPFIEDRPPSPRLVVPSPQARRA